MTKTQISAPTFHLSVLHQPFESTHGSSRKSLVRCSDPLRKVVHILRHQSPHGSDKLLRVLLLGGRELRGCRRQSQGLRTGP